MRRILVASMLVAGAAVGAEEAVRGWSMPGDTPTTLADPEGMRQKIGRLREQDSWRQFATPAQISLFEGPETEWPRLPKDAYDLTGIDRAVIGSKVPAPGVHPRILFSPEDLPGLRQKLIGTRIWIETEEQMRKTILNPQSDDGKVFSKLAAGDVAGLEFPDDGSQGGNGNHTFKGYGGGIGAAHVCYWPRNLNAIGFYALLKEDKELGPRVANALVNYYRLREPLIDKQNARAKDPNAEDAWPGDVWRQMHYVAGEGHLGLAYDVTAMYMTPEQKEFMRRIIGKATAGKRSYSANGPVRWRMTNWTGWDLQHVLTHLAIEGEEGFEQAIVDDAAETIYGYLTYGISPNGTLYETNGKNGAGLHFALVTAVALARRGHEDLLGHPHLRKMSASQVQQVVPAGGRNVNNGTYGCALFDGAGLLKNLYPGDPCADWLILQGRPNPEAPDLKAYRERLSQERSLHRLYPLTADGYLDVATFQGRPGKESWERDDLGLPLDFTDENHGQLCTRSSNDKDALYMMFEARPDLMSGGHQHFDAGHFYLSADGVDWGVEGDNGIRSSLFHSVVMIDGIGQGDNGHFSPVRVQTFKAVAPGRTAFAWADLKHAYDYIGTSPMHYSWAIPARKEFTWEPDTDPFIVACYKGTQHSKCRVWMHSYWHENWGPPMRAPYNVVRYAYRTAGLVRGARPYALVVDDIAKDDGVHLYDWQMQLPRGVVMASWWKMPAGLIVLARREDCRIDRFTTPNKGAPCLAVLVLNRNVSPHPPLSDVALAAAEIRSQSITGTDRLVIPTRAVDPGFRIALVPFRFGEPIPEMTRADPADSVTLKWERDPKDKAGEGQQDVLAFMVGADHRTRVTLRRGGETLLETK